METLFFRHCKHPVKHDEWGLTFGSLDDFFSTRLSRNHHFEAD